MLALNRSSDLLMCLISFEAQSIGAGEDNFEIATALNYVKLGQVEHREIPIKYTMFLRVETNDELAQVFRSLFNWFICTWHILKI